MFVQDNVIAQTTETNPKVFISYSRKDMGFADKLEAALKARGFEVLIDREEIYAFEDWWQRIQALIAQADTIVFVLSPDAVVSDVALKEVGHGAALNKRFAPIVARRVEDEAIPQALRKLNFIFFDDPAEFDAGVDRLAAALLTDIGWVRAHTEYGEAERRWSAAGRPNGLLLQSPTLDLAEYWLSSRPRNAPEPTEQVRSYLLASRKRARASQRTRRLVLACTFTFMAATILGLVGWINQSFIADQWRWWTVTRPYMLSQVRPHVLTATQEQALKPGDAFKECAQDCPEMIVIPAGSFTMGGSSSNKVLQPQHVVTISKPFAVAKFELSFADWDACVSGGGCNGYKPNDQGWGRGRQPVINVNWNDARAYVAWLSQVSGKTYRLLSEAEYEYAARAGSTTAFPWGDDIGTNNADCESCGSKWDAEQSAPAGSFPPNKFGLYDTVGNVWEWTDDCLHLDYAGAPPDGSAWLEANGGDCSNRLMRGGSYSDPPSGLHTAGRGWNTTEGRNSIFSFRIARTLDTR
ncbi:MAG: SUMF1/EgtB/PvdO family nonheme iron enzyme [Xanthobacteraceae bacterium]